MKTTSFTTPCWDGVTVLPRVSGYPGLGDSLGNGGSRAAAQRHRGKGVCWLQGCSLGWPLQEGVKVRVARPPGLDQLSGVRDRGKMVAEAKACLSPQRPVASEQPLGRTPLLPPPCSEGSHRNPSLTPNIQRSQGR